MSSARRIHGLEVLPMGFSPRGKDRIYHVHKHFLDPEWYDAWASAEPRSRPGPEHFAPQVARAAVGLGPWIMDPFDSAWWRGDLVVQAQEAHDQGYAPRYLHMFRVAGPLLPGSAWMPRPDQGRDRLNAEVLGFRIAVTHREGEQRCRVVTAFPTPVLRDHRSRADPMAPFVEILRDCLADHLPRVPSLSPTPSGDRSRS
jgi:hypothetical protein